MHAGDDREEKGLRLDDFAKKVHRAKGWGNREPITMEAHQNRGWERRQGGPGAPGPKNSESQISVVCSQLGRCGVLLKGRV